MTSTATRRANPFPGLRPFEENEDELFFGRDEQIDDLVGRLRRRRFIAVIGTSGSGKSSLVRAGLLPALHGGFMSGAGSRWRVVTMRPGGSPIANLASALDAAGLAGASNTARETRLGLTRAGLDRGSRGLVEVLRDADLGPHDNVLLVVDQFEELFRFQQDNPNEAAAFVKLLLAASESPDIPVYVLLTMRSDFLGDCAQFGELAQRINDGLFLVPRMTWDQLRDAIEMPVRAAGADIQPALVTRLLNDLGDNPDQLPVLQHALMRTWDLRPETGDVPFVLTLDDLARTGGLDDALSQHGDAVLATLDERDRLATEKLFKCITELGNDNRGIRRPTRLGRICAITGVPFADMCRVVEAFRAPECSFLAVRAGQLTENTVIDIAHEGLMRLWKPLTVWVQEEARSAQQYRRLATAATLHAENNAALWRNPDLQIAENWRAHAEPNAAWANHVDPRLDFAQTMAFLDASIAERARERAARLRRNRLIIGGLAVLVVILSGITAIAVQQAHLAATERVETVVSESHFLARDANAAVDRGDAVTGMLLALQALKIGGEDAPPEADRALQSALSNQRERMDLIGHNDVVEGVAFSPDGRHIVSGGGLTLIVWDAATGAQLRVLRGHTGGGLSWATYSPDGREILSSGDHTARVWNAATGAPIAVFSVPATNAESATYSPDGNRIVVASDDRLARIWDVRSRRVVSVLRGHTGTVLYAAFSPDGERVITASADKTARVWDATTGKQLFVLRGHTNSIQSAAFSPDGHRITTGSVDDTMRIWNATTGAPLAVVSADSGGVNSVAYSSDGRLLVSSGTDGTLRVWDTAGMHPVETLAGHNGTVNVAAFSADGKRLVSGSFDRTVRVWDVASRARVVVLRGHTDQVFSAAFSPDGTRIVTGSADHTARLWNATTGAPLAVLRGHKGAVAAAFSPDRHELVTAGGGTVRFWNAANGALLATYPGSKGVENVAYSPDGRAIATAALDGTVRIFDSRTGARTRIFRSANYFWQADFSPDGKRIVTAGNDATARIYNARTGTQLRIFRDHEGPVYSAAFSPDGTRVVSASLDRTLRVWDAATGQQRLILYGHKGPVIGAAFSPDGRYIASASFDNTVRIWDATSGTQISVLQGHEGYVYRATYSADGRRVASASADGTARMWDIPPELSRDDLIAQAKNDAPRQLSPSQRAQEFLP